MRPPRRHVLVLATALLALAGCSELSDLRGRDRHDSNNPRAENRARLDLNSASRDQLAKLPGLTDEDADRIVANRPYQSTRGLVRKNVIGENKYERIEPYVYASDRR